MEPDYEKMIRDLIRQESFNIPFLKLLGIKIDNSKKIERLRALQERSKPI